MSSAPEATIQSLKSELLEDLRRRSPVTLLFGARDEAHNNAVVLRELLQEKRRKGKAR
jgi:uncharacterized protein YeaO (DUF488 family)